MTHVLDQRFDALGNSIAGQVLEPETAEYDKARAIWNGAIDKRPAAIVQCASPADVARAITFARRENLEISVRGGAHSYGGASLTDGGLTIDLTRMKSVRVDPTTRVAHCGAGANWGDVDAATQEHGLAVTGGLISHTGIGGLTLGGGMGWLMNSHGLTIDNLISVELVTADGRRLRASQTEHPDLFWALRGGGGNFGVATEFVYRLHPVGPVVQFGLLFWDMSAGTEALRLARKVVDSLPRSMGAVIGGLNAPPAPFVPEQHHFTLGIGLLLAGLGSVEEHSAVVDSVREQLPPLFEMVGPMPYTQMQQLLDESAPWGIQAYGRALALDNLTDGAIDVIVDHLPRKKSPMSLMPIFATVGGYAEHDDEETAFGGSRASRYMVGIDAVAPTPELLEADRAWCKDLWEALLPHATGVGSYVNFMTEYDEDRVLASYGKAKYDRLAKVKATYDPDNVFHLNANIKPAIT